MSASPLRRLAAFLITSLTMLAVAGPTMAASPSGTTQRVSAASAASGYTSTFARGLTGGGPTFSGGTIRMPIDPTTSGTSARLTLTNKYGASPLQISGASLATQANGSVATEKPRPVTFGGSRTVTIPAGQDVTSDPLDFPVVAGKALLVSLAVPSQTPVISFHLFGIETTYFSGGNQVDVLDIESLGGGKTTEAYILKSLEVNTPDGVSMVALGDSITDGQYTVPGKQQRWTQQLAARLRASGVNNVAIPNVGIAGNQVTANSGVLGDAAINRFNDDVLKQAGVRSVFLFEGINDIQGDVSAQNLIAGLSSIVSKARAAGLSVNISTIGPWRGWGSFNATRESTRQTVNQWIRTSSGADYVADFDAALRDPNNTSALLPAYDSGDHLHPSPAGQTAMANAVDLSKLAYVPRFVSTYSRSLTKGGPNFTGGTIRMPIDPTMSGPAATLRLSNQFGTSALQIGHVTIAQQASGGNATATPTTVTFGGQQAVSIPAGQVLTSDPVPVPIVAGQTQLVSIYVPGPTPTIAMHAMGMEPTYFGGGDATGSVSVSAYNAGTTNSTYILSSLQVATGGGKAIVALGDSITDGAATTPGQQERWPQRLAARLRGAGLTNVSVPNAGISANKVTIASNGTDGDSAVNRFDADVLAQPGIGSVFIFEGINDMQQSVSASSMITAYQNLISRARARGLKVNMATVGPWKGWGTYTAEREATRQQVNNWIRTSSGADYVADFDAALRNPADPSALAPGYDSGDHLHPNPVGMQAMANAVDLSRLAY